MARASGPHTRNPVTGAVYRGSKRRVSRLSPFEELPVNLWLFVAVALLMLGVCVMLIYREV